MNGFSQMDISKFPVAEKGFKKVVIELPTKKNEDNLKFEFKVGKNAEVDKCNKFFLVGTLKEATLQGYGYNYYRFSSNGEVAGTKMGCMDNETVSKFVTSEAKIIRYNSKLPVVIYVPEGMEVQYRIWKSKNKWVTTK